MEITATRFPLPPHKLGRENTQAHTAPIFIASTNGLRLFATNTTLSNVITHWQDDCMATAQPHYPISRSSFELAELFQVGGQAEHPLHGEVADVDEAVALLVGSLARLVADQGDAAGLAAAGHPAGKLFQELQHR